MNSKCISIKRILIINIITILFSAIFAIIVHASLPSSLDDIQFDSMFVELFGFPFVASFYFILLFTHCAIVLRYIGVRSEASKFQLSIRFGAVFAMVYLLGMQEVVVEATAFSEWGMEFVKHNLIMAMGDSIPAILLCFVISFFTIENKAKSNLLHKLNFWDIIKAVSIIAIAIVVGRTVAYETGIITSNNDTYPIPTYAWTVLFGLMLGFIYVILYPLLAYKNNLNCIPLRLIVVVGVNWIIFNSFIGLIFKDVMVEMLLRSGLDVLILFITSMIIGKYIVAKEFIGKPAGRSTVCRNVQIKVKHNKKESVNMKPMLIVYKTKTGFTKKYVDWIAKEVACQSVPLHQINNVDMNSYDIIIYGAGMHAGRIQGLKEFKNKIINLSSKDIVVFATGAAPNTDEIISTIKSVNFSANELNNIEFFYFQSGMNYENMGLVDKAIMKIYSTALEFKNNKSDIEDGTSKAISKSYDHSSREYINPMIDYLDHLLNKPSAERTGKN